MIVCCQPSCCNTDLLPESFEKLFGTLALLHRYNKPPCLHAAGKPQRKLTIAPASSNAPQSPVANPQRLFPPAKERILAWEQLGGVSHEHQNPSRERKWVQKWG